LFYSILQETFQKNKERITRSAIRLAVLNSLFLFAKITGVTLLSAICIAVILAFIATAAYFKLKNFTGTEGQRYIY